MREQVCRWLCCASGIVNVSIVAVSAPPPLELWTPWRNYWGSKQGDVGHCHITSQTMWAQLEAVTMAMASSINRQHRYLQHRHHHLRPHHQTFRPTARHHLLKEHCCQLTKDLLILYERKLRSYRVKCAGTRAVASTMEWSLAKAARASSGDLRALWSTTSALATRTA